MLMTGQLAFAATSLTYQYDTVGNVISGDGKYYEYNDANRLVRVRHKNASGPMIAEYVYDHAGQRVKKIENGVVTYYIGKHFEKTVDGGTELSSKYYFAGGERVARKDATGAISFYHGDHLGGTNVLTNGTGALVEKTTYYPFGEVREGGKERFAYTGKEKDGATGWYYYEARHYNQQFRHFTQADVIFYRIYDPQSLNKYAYVRNNPTKLVDPSGHVWWNPFDWFQNKQSRNATSSAYKKTTDLATVDIPRQNTSTITEKGFDNWAQSFGSGRPRYDSPFHTPYSKGKTYEVDVSGKLGSDVSAFRSGIVVDSHSENSGPYGKYIVIKDSQGNTHKYAHLLETQRTDNDEIFAGESVGKMGNSGNVLKSDGSRPTPQELSLGYGSHLHYELRNSDNELIAPYGY